MLIKIPRHKVRQFSISCCRMRRKPKQERDPSKRNLQGEDLIERLRRRENDLVRQKVCQKFKYTYFILTYLKFITI